MWNRKIISSWIHKIFPLYKNRSIVEKANISAKTNSIIRAFVQDQIKIPDTFNSTISENDEMYLFPLGRFKGNKDRACIEYLVTGKQSMDIIRQIIQWKFKSFDNLSAFLDFASGYGRFTRHLIQEFPADRIWVCDIYADAIKFQTEQFRVHGIVSVPNPKDYHDDKGYDCIFVASLFSHLPEKTFASWLKKLYDLLTPRGLLIFSVHDFAVLPPHLKMREEGILYIPESESRSLNKDYYGTTYVNESFVSSVINELTGISQYYRKKRGLWWYQDIYIISKDKNVNFSSLDLLPGPSGYLDSCILNKADEIHFNGWSADFSKDTSIKDIRILINGATVHRCLPCYDRPDVAEAFQDNKGLKSGFSCYLKKNIVKPTDIIMVKIINSRDIEYVLRVGTLGSILD